MKTQKNTTSVWLYGHHAVTEALKNPNRQKICLKATKENLPAKELLQNVPVQIVSREELNALLGKEAIHQGLALQTKPLPDVMLEDIIDRAESKTRALIVILDQVTDPHNIGAILRSAAAFDAMAVILPDMNTPEQTATLAKSACGALEIVPLVRVTNLVRAMNQLKQAGFWCIGLDGYAKQMINDRPLPEKTVFIMGSEGEGMRRLTAENCDYTVKLPMTDKMESLNVSNATAIALYEWYQKHQ